MKDVKGALMGEMKAMMQNELRQALAELMPPLAPAAVAPIANPPGPLIITMLGGNF